MSYNVPAEGNIVLRLEFSIADAVHQRGLLSVLGTAISAWWNRPRLPSNLPAYLRADVGLGIYHEVSASESGTTYGAIQGGIGALNSFGSGPSWFSTDFNTFASYGVGVGLYVTPRVRGDITVDARTESNINGRGTYSYALYNHAVAPVAPIGVTVFGTVSDRTEVRTTAGLMNVYYDLTDRGALTPYVGIGAKYATSRRIPVVASCTSASAPPMIPAIACGSTSWKRHR